MQTECPMCHDTIVIPPRQNPASSNQHPAPSRTYSITCPNCGQSLEAQDEWANMQTECPMCHDTIVIPPRQTPQPQFDVPQSAGFVQKQIDMDEPYISRAYLPMRILSNIFSIFAILSSLTIFCANDEEIRDILYGSLFLCSLSLVISKTIQITFSPGIRFRLLPGEQLLHIIRIRGKEKKTLGRTTFFIRITNARLLVSKIKYPWYLKSAITGILELVIQPKTIDYEWTREDINSVTLEKKKTVVQSRDGKVLSLEEIVPSIFEWYGVEVPKKK